MNRGADFKACHVTLKFPSSTVSGLADAVPIAVARKEAVRLANGR